MGSSRRAAAIRKISYQSSPLELKEKNLNLWKLSFPNPLLGGEKLDGISSERSINTVFALPISLAFKGCKIFFSSNLNISEITSNTDQPRNPLIINVAKNASQNLEHSTDADNIVLMTSLGEFLI